jgi:hypothetical protein
MGYPTKIATCCYCGTRAALVLDRARHELSCAQCGAPLHDLKMLRVERDVAPAQPQPVASAKVKKSKHRRNPKRKKAFGFKKLVEEVFDLVDDILD